MTTNTMPNSSKSGESLNRTNPISFTDACALTFFATRSERELIINKMRQKARRHKRRRSGVKKNKHKKQPLARQIEEDSSDTTDLDEGDGDLCRAHVLDGQDGGVAAGNDKVGGVHSSEEQSDDTTDLDEGGDMHQSSASDVSRGDVAAMGGGKVRKCRLEEGTRDLPDHRRGSEPRVVPEIREYPRLSKPLGNPSDKQPNTHRSDSGKQRDRPPMSLTNVFRDMPRLLPRSTHKKRTTNTASGKKVPPLQPGPLANVFHDIPKLPDSKSHRSSKPRTHKPAPHERENHTSQPPTPEPPRIHVPEVTQPRGQSPSRIQNWVDSRPANDLDPDESVAASQDPSNIGFDGFSTVYPDDSASVRALRGWYRGRR